MVSRPLEQSSTAAARGLDLLVVSGCFPPAWSWGGQSKSIWTMCRGLARAGARVHVVTTDADLEGRVRVPRQRDEEGMRVTTRKVIGSGAAMRFALAPGLVPEVWRAAGRADLCVMQGVWTFPLLVAPRICCARGVPYVIIPQGTLEDRSLGEKAFKKRCYLRLVERSNLRRAAAVQFSSEAERNNSRGTTAGRPALVHANAVDIERPVARAAEALRQRLGLAEDVRIAGIAGRLHPRKGFDVIVPALAGTSPRLHLAAFGADEAGYGARIESLALEQGVAERVHFLGQLGGEELQAVYAAVDLLVLPSHGESFGNTALEALAQGTEVMVSEAVPLAPWIRDRALGIVVHEPGAAGWAAALEGWLRRERPFDRARASRLVREEFDLARAGRRLLAEYRRLVSAPTVAPPAAGTRAAS